MENLLGYALNATDSQDLITSINAYKVYMEKYFTFIWNTFVGFFPQIMVRDTL